MKIGIKDLIWSDEEIDYNFNNKIEESPYFNLKDFLISNNWRLSSIIKEAKEQNTPILLAKPFSMKDIKTVVSEVLGEMVGKNDKI